MSPRLKALYKSVVLLRRLVAIEERLHVMRLMRGTLKRST
jgi:hypothetical protein